MKRMKVNLVLGLVCLVGVLMIPSLAAAVGECSNCHTMHYSQGGSLGATPNARLLTATCQACHTGDNAAGSRPYVIDTGDPGVTALAGGNFYWVNTGSDAKGHNVSGTANPADAALGNVPPGGTNLGGVLSCAGTRGCHGGRVSADEMTDMSGSHHGNSAGIITTSATDIGGSYRFLSGIHGYEDTDWELTKSATDHNEYKGYDRYGAADSTNTNVTTISSLCAKCHGDFHYGAGKIGLASTMQSPWLRHPTDFDMDNLDGGSEYAAYAFSTLAPPARLTIAAASSSVAGTDDEIVMCMSCHRAHGTAYDDLLRWDYSAGNCQTGVDQAACGCFQCHTTKDAG